MVENACFCVSLHSIITILEMLEKASGIVLHYNRYNDDSAIVDIYTLSRGSVSFLVRDRRRQRKSGTQTMLLRPLTCHMPVMPGLTDILAR